MTTPTGTTPSRSIWRGWRRWPACQLTVTEVCHAVGFASLGSFSTRFRAVVGETPSEFQARYAAAGAPHVPGCYVFMRGLVETASLVEIASQEKPSATDAS